MVVLVVVVVEEVKASDWQVGLWLDRRIVPKRVRCRRTRKGLKKGRKLCESSRADWLIITSDDTGYGISHE